MAKKEPKVFVSSTAPVEDPFSEWARRRNEPGSETVRMFSARSNDYVLKTCGRERAQRTELLKRGKVTAVHFIFY